MPTCVPIFTPQTGQFSDQASPFTRIATELFTELCVEAPYPGFTFMNREPYLFMDGSAKVTQAGDIL